MNNYLSEDEHRNPSTYDQKVATTFNVSLSVTPHLPFAIYFCYSLPEKTQQLWIEHFQKFVNFKDFQYAFMQNILGNILTFMDIYEKAAVAAQNGDFITVMNQAGRAIRRILIFDSMLSSPLEGDEDEILYTDSQSHL